MRTSLVPGAMEWRLSERIPFNTRAIDSQVEFSSLYAGVVSKWSSFPVIIFRASLIRFWIEEGGNTVWGSPALRVNEIVRR